jgi:hypothetical protein
MRTKLTIAAVLLWLALAVYPVLVSDDLLLLALSALSVPTLIVALVAPRTSAGVLTAALLAVEYAAALLASELEVDYAAPAVAVAWFLLLELFDQVALVEEEADLEPRVRWRRMIEMLLFVVVGGGGALFAFVLSLIARGSGPVGAAVATVFGLVALALPVRLAAVSLDGH